MYPIYGANDSYFEANSDNKIYNYLCYYPPETPKTTAHRLIVLTDFNGSFSLRDLPCIMVMIHNL